MIANFIDNNDDDNHSKRMPTQNGQYIGWTAKDKSIRSFEKVVKKLIAFKDKICTFASYMEWIKNGRQVLNDGNIHFLEDSILDPSKVRF